MNRADDVRQILGQEQQGMERPLAATLERLTDLTINHTEWTLRAQGNTAGLDEWQRITGKIDRLQRAKGIWSAWKTIKGCLELGVNIAKLTASWITTATETDLSETDSTPTTSS